MAGSGRRCWSDLACESNDHNLAKSSDVWQGLARFGKVLLCAVPEAVPPLLIAEGCPTLPFGKPYLGLAIPQILKPFHNMTSRIMLLPLQFHFHEREPFQLLNANIPIPSSSQRKRWAAQQGLRNLQAEVKERRRQPAGERFVGMAIVTYILASSAEAQHSYCNL